MTPTNPTHGRIEVNVAAALGAFVRTQNPGIVMAGEDIAGENVLPGFVLPVDEVFA